MTHVLVISDSAYSKKADTRKAGVGTESQIISKEVYEKVEQSKFIPIVCEFEENGKPFLPTFFASRIWIDFSSPESVNNNWEQLIRLLYGKPLHQKPTIGKPPAYIRNDSAAPPSPATSKYFALMLALQKGRAGIKMYRQDFLDACIDYADSLRIRKRPDVEELGARVLEDCNKLKPIRDHLVDWVLLESALDSRDEFTEPLLRILERMLELKSRPSELNAWNETWFEAHSLFAYETFLYIISSLMRTSSWEILHDIFSEHYLLPETDRHGTISFTDFGRFYAYSETLQKELAPEGQRLISPAAAFIKKQANRADIPFKAIIEADLLVTLAALTKPDSYWHPQTFVYAEYGQDFPFFLRAERLKDFQKIAIVTGIPDADQLRSLVSKKIENDSSLTSDFSFRRRRSPIPAMNIEKLGTLS